MKTNLFVNLPVKNLDRSVDFFTKVGFTFNPQYTDEKGTCMVIGEDIYVMLLAQEYFRTFTKKQVYDAAKGTEVILALSAESREKVDEIVHRATDAGANTPTSKQDLGFMYGWGFEDLDGHLWEVFYMEPGVGSKVDEELIL